MWLIFRSVDWLYFAFKKNFLVHGLQRLTLIAIKLWKKLVLWILMSTSAIHALTGNFFRQFFNVTVYKTFCKLALIIFYGTPPKSTYSGHTEWLLWLKTQLRQNFCQKGRRTGPSAAQEPWQCALHCLLLSMLLLFSSLLKFRVISVLQTFINKYIRSLKPNWLKIGR